MTDTRDRGQAAIVIVCVVILAVMIFLIAWLNGRTNDRINDCIAKGGTPVVVGHAYTSEFKTCVLP